MIKTRMKTWSKTWRRMLVALVPTLLFSGGMVHAGGAVGNGGGFAQCEDGHYYLFDYLITNQSDFGPDRRVSTYTQSLAAISSQLERLGEPLHASLNEFVRSAFTDLPGNHYRWRAHGSLKKMWEPGIEALLPERCRHRRQAVYFFPADSIVDYVTYLFDPNLLELVGRKEQGQLQLSYLIIHEWLWNHFGRARAYKLAQFNRLLHAEQLNTMTREEYQKRRRQILD